LGLESVPSRNEEDMNIKINTSKYETEFDVPEKKLELVRALLFEVATGAKNTPK
jgi:hypothetical protein